MLINVAVNYWDFMASVNNQRPLMELYWKEKITEVHQKHLSKCHIFYCKSLKA